MTDPHFVDEFLNATTAKGFPIVVSKESQYLVGFVERRDITLSLGTVKSCQLDSRYSSLLLKRRGLQSIDCRFSLPAKLFS